MNKIDKVIIFGGTHGNEWTGIYLIKEFAQVLSKEFPQLNLQFILSNPEAYRENKRFKDEDLNRAFQFLDENRTKSYEHERAKQLKKMIDEEPCFIIDLHTTTSNMGPTMIITQDHHLNFQLAKKCLDQKQDLKIIYSPDPQKKYLASQSETGVIIEVGPVANGLINDLILKQTLELTRAVLNSLTWPLESTGNVEIYHEEEDVYYPQNDQGEITAIIHEKFQGNDFIPIHGNYRPFKKFTGEEVELRTSFVAYPIFINEAAYYHSKLAFTLCSKKRYFFDAKCNTLSNKHLK